MIEVNIGACTCPGTPHPDGDVVYLRDKMTLAGGSILSGIVADYIGTPLNVRPPVSTLIADLRVAYVQQGVVGWNLSAEGADLALTPETLREQVIDDYARGILVADRADDLYYAPVLAPLLERVGQLSQPTPTKKRTSATKSSASTAKKSNRSRLRSIPGSSEPPTTLKPSSTTTSQTGSTERTSIELVSASSS